ncbi:MAG TPA: LysR family transcriptional regulator, partial [Caulobacter sp.]|nr:LysR family transcriptional regulator [Caulobacter sp.]
MDGLDPRSLDVFRAILETGSATAAAHRLRMTQPAVTRAIAVLEQQTGLNLFERGKFGMRPTPQGELFAIEVQRSYSGLARVKAAAAAIRQGLVGELVIAALPVLSDGFAARALGGFAVAAPDVRIGIVHLPADEMVRRVLAGSVDMALTAGPLVETPGLSWTAFGHRPMMALVPLSHPLAERSVVEVPDLKGTELVMYMPVNPYRGILERAFAAQGVAMTFRIEVMTLRSAARVGLTAGLISLVDSEIAAEAIAQFPGVRAIPFRDARSWEVIAVY